MNQDFKCISVYICIYFNTIPWWCGRSKYFMTIGRKNVLAEELTVQDGEEQVPTRNQMQGWIQSN